MKLTNKQVSFLLLGIVVVLYAAKRANLPLGIRYNNPLNIRYNPANNWQGATGVNARGFVIFDKPENGIRAAAKVLKSYARQGVNRLGPILIKWAPPTENKTLSYISHVEELTGISSHDVVSQKDYTRLLAAMIRHENANYVYPELVVQNGVLAA
tara:strand:- start:361 stop:825 length:465 start_codon:yes stop_codon:yes gene_type:complete